MLDLQYSSHMILFNTRQKKPLWKTVMESVKSDENDFCGMFFFYVPQSRFFYSYICWTFQK